MTPSESAARTDLLSPRINALTCSLASAAIGLGADMVDTLLADVLRQLGEILDADSVTLETRTAAGESVGLRRTWGRPGTGRCDEAASIDVACGNGRTSLLSVRRHSGLEPWSVATTDALKAFVHVAVLLVERETRSARSDRMTDKQTGASPVWSPVDASADDFENIIGDSPALRFAISRVGQVAATDASVMLLGETGTGKELFARAIHNRSTRCGRPFVRVNCAALPSTLIETELFGHVRGAFTGAVTNRQGRFEIADGGTLFLDEIGDLPADVQAKLLRVLQEGEFERVGSSQPRKVDVRIVAATHHDLEEAMNAGKFRADLYYRLNVFPIVLPPLRQRTEDIPRLVWYFVNRRQRALNRKFTNIPVSVFAALQQRPWPGNVRELQNVIERAMIHSGGNTLVLDDAPSSLPAHAAKGAPTLEELEKQYVEDALRRCRWRINGRGNAAEALGLHPNTLRNRMKKFGIRRPANQASAEDRLTA
jgi:transcriptional regulator with GAF, ATPase, and Fis domain